MADYSGAYSTTPRARAADPAQTLLGEMSNVLKRLKMAEGMRATAHKEAKMRDEQVEELQEEFNTIREKLVEAVPELLTGFADETVALDGEGHVVVVKS